MNFAEMSNVQLQFSTTTSILEGEIMTNGNKEIAKNNPDKPMPTVQYVAGQKGGCGKTAMAMCLAEWFDKNRANTRKPAKGRKKHNNELR